MMSISRNEVVWLLVCGAVALALCVSLLPDEARAVKNDANKQCPPGGQKGQPCKDNTNGYITDGKCEFIYFCKATNWDKNPPSKCDGAIGSQNCPTGKPYKAPAPNQPPYVIPKKSATSTPSRIRIPGRSVSEIENSVLDAAFSSEDDVSLDVDAEVLSESANAALLALLEGSASKETGAAETDAGEYLIYAPESFEIETSTLYQDLRDSAIALSADKSRAPYVGKNSSGELEALYAYSGTLEYATPYAVGGGGSERSVNSRAAWSAFSGYVFANLSNWIGLLISALVHLISAAGNVALADFTAAGTHWNAAQADFANSYAHLMRTFSALFTQVSHVRLW